MNGIVNRDHINASIGIAWHVFEDAEAKCDGQAAQESCGVSPARHGLLSRCSDNGRSKHHKTHWLLCFVVVRDEQVLSHALRIAIDIWEVSYEIVLIVINLEVSHPADLIVVSLPVHILFRVDSFLDIAVTVAVHEAGGNLQESFEVGAVVGQFEELERARNIDTDGRVNPLLEVDGGGAIDDDIQVLLDLIDQLLIQIQVSLSLKSNKNAGKGVSETAQQKKVLTRSSGMGTNFSATSLLNLLRPSSSFRRSKIYESIISCLKRVYSAFGCPSYDI